MIKRKNVYLDEIGIDFNKLMTTYVNAENSNKNSQQKNMAFYKKHGFHASETWNLTDFTCIYVYTRLQGYNEINLINCEFHKYEHNGKTYNMQQGIDFILKHLKRYLYGVFNDKIEVDIPDKEMNKLYEDMEESMIVYAKILKYLNW